MSVLGELTSMVMALRSHNSSALKEAIRNILISGDSTEQQLIRMKKLRKNFIKNISNPVRGGASSNRRRTDAIPPNQNIGN